MYGGLGAVMDRYVDSILAGGPLVLPLEGASAPVYVDEAVATEALRHYDQFIAETESHTREFLPAPRAHTITEAFRYQTLITPRWGHPEPIVVVLYP